MKKDKITLPIGSNNALLFEADLNDMKDQDFVKQCIHVAAGKPQTIQDFFIRLNDMQQKQFTEAKRKTGRKM